ncbi:MAG TPA: S8 family peptidase, partial [Burkholderiales bacterium]|nr:S8 family peptidase [Burkholderiales bacterium]
MRRKTITALALAIAGCFAARAFAAEASPESPEARELPALGSPAPTAALIAAGVAAAAALASRARGGAAADSAGDPGGASSLPPRTLSYTSAADFRTDEFLAQPGLSMVKADRLYYHGHYRWYRGDAPDPAAGTGVGVKIAVADTGINPQKGATGAAIVIDVAASYDYVRNRPGSAADDYGHGTHVAGIIAAPKTGAAMHGLAYNATIVNFKVGDAVVTASDAQLADLLGRAAAAGAMIINNSWGSPAAITSYSTEALMADMPRMIEASRAYVAKSGVVVFAAGNDARAQPSLQAGLPHRITGLEPGWLAVVAVDGSGRLAGYSNRCGVAAAWCLAAPGGSAEGGIYSMHNNGDYAQLAGTSMAAPHAAAALGALKSMFPNLSALQIRDRLLYTANRSGPYADASAYGQGLMDLDAASSPVGGVAVPTGTSASGPTASVAGSGIRFQSGALRAVGVQPWVLVVDNFQRAPFWVPAETFFRETPPQLIERQWASLRSAPRSAARGLASPLSFSHSPGHH